MSTTEIVAELARLSRHERRRVIAAALELDEEGALLQDCDRRAAENFRLLDLMEEQDGSTATR